MGLSWIYVLLEALLALALMGTAEGSLQCYNCTSTTQDPDLPCLLGNDTVNVTKESEPNEGRYEYCVYEIEIGIPYSPEDRGGSPTTTKKPYSERVIYRRYKLSRSNPEPTIPPCHYCVTRSHDDGPYKFCVCMNDRCNTIPFRYPNGSHTSINRMDLKHPIRYKCDSGSLVQPKTVFVLLFAAVFVRIAPINK